MPFGQKFYKVLAIASLVGLAIVIPFTYSNAQRISQESKERDQQNRTIQRQNCRQVGDPLLHSQVVDLHNDITDVHTQQRQSKELDLRRVFPNLSKQELDQLIKRGRKRQEARIERDRIALAPLENAPTCAERYPPLDG